MTEEEGECCSDCCIYCCCTGVSALGYLFCCRKMRLATRTKLLFLYITVLSLTFGILTAVVFFGPHTSHFSPTDMRIVTEKLSSTFCNSVTLISTESFTAYLLDSGPVIDRRQRQVYNVSTTNYLNKGSFNYDKFYLLDGSVLEVLLCSRSFIQFGVVKGDQNFDNFIDKGFKCDTCFERPHTYEQNECNGIVYSVLDSDEYFIVYASPEKDAWLTSYYNVGRTLYNVSTALHSCTSSFHCSFDLDLKNYFVVVHLGKSAILRQSDVKSKCSARLWVHLIIFIVVPCILGAFMRFLIKKYCKDHVDDLSRDSLLNHTGTINYQSNSDAGLPRYEDIFRSDETRPPSYEDVIRNGTMYIK